MIQVIQVDFTNPRHQSDLMAMLDAYAQDVMGGGKPMAADVKSRLVPGLRVHPAAYSFLAYKGDPGSPGDPVEDGEAVGIANCFLGFSTFAARPLINIHDLAVASTVRRMGVGRKLLDAVKAKAESMGCCAITLEVRDDNPVAQKLYESYGFRDDAGVPHRFKKLKV